LDAFSLIAKLNPRIRGWCNYYNLGNSSRYRDYVRQALYQLCWKWCNRKHPSWGKKAIAKSYFVIENNTGQYLDFKGYLWTFRGQTFKDSVQRKRNYLLNPLTTNSILSAKHYIIPENLVSLHAFSDSYMKLIELNSKKKGNILVLRIN
jgi:hypothetical protein